MDHRATILTGLPVANPTQSYWQNPPSDIADHRTTEALPSSADYVVVGSGISGACVAYNLLLRRPAARVVILEARRACSGATGRNGGHTKAASYRSFAAHERAHGAAEAVKIARLEHANIEATHAFAREHGMDCESRPTDTVDVVLDQSHLEAGIAAIRHMQSLMRADEGAARYEIHEAEEAKRRFLTPNALGAFTYEAGSINAYKFAIGILKLCLKSGLNLQTSTPATHISSLRSEASPRTQGSCSDDAQINWAVETSRGTINTAHLILATNGYTPHLLPNFQGVIVPLRGQVTAHRPGSNMPTSGLPTTYSFIYAKGYDYMIPRPPDTEQARDIVIGGALGKLPLEGASEYGETDDALLNPEASGFLREATVQYFGAQNWGQDHPDGRVRSEWTGIMGASADGLPYVGPVPGSEKLWMSASFNGHGMVLCLKCAEALVELICGAETPEWFPRSFLVREERLRTKFRGRLDLTAPELPEVRGDKLSEVSA
ncbi:hypothetical protein B0A49_03146 [Cryomyces minteri]|uniref:FAD dependent oxidoreductase domain-containing protein n=1 Tax=Cryomyces minteri TaxID=331657 RepID=A0A4U0WF70_9PEZI|nr:hypothetical protein B0A49_11012 [Cryomyces minteri]TKA62658.1 hypothetical protein B0A49_06793 [Cryomyces minteri]TKA73936.1 hypothetical protein B0A49_03146 [Cryomyces minteri]